MNTENVRLKYLFELNMGQSPDSDACNMDGNGVPFLHLLYEASNSGGFYPRCLEKLCDL